MRRPLKKSEIKAMLRDKYGYLSGTFGRDPQKPMRPTLGMKRQYTAPESAVEQFRHKPYIKSKEDPKDDA